MTSSFHISVVSRLKQKFLFYCICLLLTNGNVQSQDSLKTVQTIYDAGGQKAVLIAANGKAYKIEFWHEGNELRRRGPKLALFENITGNTSGFTGLSRMFAKTTNVSPQVYRSFRTMKDIFTKYRLPVDSIMRRLVTRKSPRVSVEKKGVVLRDAYLFGFKKQRDNDYHLIVGDKPNIDKAFLMTMEISGLPVKNNAALVKARNDFIAAFKINDNVAMQAYILFTENPVPVHVEGPLFYDINHRSGSIGPKNGKFRLKLKTAWEIHPITKFSLRE
jgi:hypothetical protein